MAPGRKTGGRIAGISKNKPKPIKLADTEENRALVLMAPMLTQGLRSPKSVMLEAMARFDAVAIRLWNQAEGLVQAGSKVSDVKTILEDSFKYSVAAVQVASQAAPYVHARLIAVQGEAAADKPAYVIRAPSVMEDSSAWQASVGAAVMDMGASAARTEVLAHPAQQQPAEPQNAPTPAAVALVADPKTNRITIMPPGPRVVQPVGTQEWLDSIKKVG